jgi:hypothetical protein
LNRYVLAPLGFAIGSLYVGKFFEVGALGCVIGLQHGVTAFDVREHLAPVLLNRCQQIV